MPIDRGKGNIQQAYLNVSLLIPVEDIKVKQRLDRAYDILVGYGYEISPVDNKGAYTVRKASTTLLEDNSAEYKVTDSECTCPDFESARGNLCKHRLAIMIMEEMHS